MVQAANYSPGVNLVLALAERLGAALPGSDYDAEILEMHHRHKIDAPSGTALALGQAVAARHSPRPPGFWRRCVSSAALIRPGSSPLGGR